MWYLWVLVIKLKLWYGIFFFFEQELGSKKKIGFITLFFVVSTRNTFDYTINKLDLVIGRIIHSLKKSNENSSILTHFLW